MAEDFKPQSSGLENIFIRGKDGKSLSLEEVFFNEQENRRHQEFPSLLLKSGDLVVCLYESEETGTGAFQHSFNFKMKEAQWYHLGVEGGFGPQKTWIVDITGLPGTEGTIEGYYVGSGWGGSVMSPGTIATDRSLSFDSYRGPLRSPFVSKLSVIRREGKEVSRIIDPTEISPNPEIVTDHEVRLKQVGLLMERFGFSKKYDFLDGKKQSFGNESIDYEDGRFIASYYAGMATGNTLNVYDKEKKAYIVCRYYNFEGQDILQVAYADLSKKSFDPQPFGFPQLGDHRIHKLGVEFVTHTSSPGLDLDAVNYRPSEEDAHELLGVPSFGETKEIFIPDIQIFSDDTTYIPDGYPFTSLDDKGVIKKMRPKVSVLRSETGRSISLSGTTRNIASTEEIFNTFSAS